MFFGVIARGSLLTLVDGIRAEAVVYIKKQQQKENEKAGEGEEEQEEEGVRECFCYCLLFRARRSPYPHTPHSMIPLRPPPRSEWGLGWLGRGGEINR